MGTRLLRTNILSPLTDTVVIDTRLDVVEEFVSSEERFHAVRKALEPYVDFTSSNDCRFIERCPNNRRLKSLDVDKLIGQIAASQRQQSFSKSSADPAKLSEAKINRLLQLRVLLHSLAALRTALYNSNSALLKTICNVLSDDRTEGILEEIAETINEDAVNSLQKGALQTRNTRIYAIKAEKKLLLDVARETCKAFNL
jgi:DNA mismatch repair protein MSH4